MVRFSGELLEFYAVKANFDLAKATALTILLPLLETHQNEQAKLIEEHASVVLSITDTTIETPASENHPEFVGYKELLVNIAKNPTRTETNNQLLDNLKKNISAKKESINSSEDECPPVLKRLTLLTDFLILQNASLISCTKSLTEVENTIIHTLLTHQEKIDEIDQAIQIVTGKRSPEPHRTL